MNDSTQRHRRSSGWFDAPGLNGFIHRSWLRNQGYPADVFDGRPVIGIATSWSELAPCNAHLNVLAQSVKNGIWEAGGFPLEFPTMATGESLTRPTAMLYRNLMAMGVEELIRANPLDGVVLLSGCDKTTPALLMGAASVDLPALMLTGGPMLSGRFQGTKIGSGTHVWRFSDDVRTRAMSQEDFVEAEACMSRSPGHCNTMGTASTMACIAEALGMQLPGSAAIPAVDSRRKALAHVAGRRIVAMVEEDLRPSAILTRQAFENAIKTNAALGGSTNAVVHLLALAGRVGVPLELDDFDSLTLEVPVLADVLPSGGHLMEDFFEAGGLPALMAELGDLLHRDQVTVTGRRLGECLAAAECWDRGVIATRDAPVQPPGSGTVVLRGSLCPDGAVLKVSAASRELLVHRGQALVFDSIEDYRAICDDLELPVTAATVLIVRNAGPKGYPGFPEVGNMPVPRVLLDAGVTDMVRVSDARMSGTGFGTCILHVAPEAAVGGPLALVRSGDWIELDVPARRLDLLVEREELMRRRQGLSDTAARPARGYPKLYVEHVLQADRGADFDFLTGSSGSEPGRHSH